MKFHAVMIDETGCEFSAEVEADNHDEAYSLLSEDYPESRIDELLSQRDRNDRHSALMRFYDEGGDFDDEGRPFYYR